MSVLTINSDSSGSVAYGTKRRLRSDIFDGAVLGYKGCQNLVLRTDIG